MNVSLLSFTLKATPLSLLSTNIRIGLTDVDAFRAHRLGTRTLGKLWHVPSYRHMHTQRIILP